jgi:hypothetical protein
MLYLLAGNYFEAREYARGEFMDETEWAYVSVNERDVPGIPQPNVVRPDAVQGHDASVRLVGTFQCSRDAANALMAIEDAGVPVDGIERWQGMIDFWRWL